jgi:hypothetical protein
VRLIGRDYTGLQPNRLVSAISDSQGQGTLYKVSAITWSNLMPPPIESEYVRGDASAAKTKFKPDSLVIIP